MIYIIHSLKHKIKGIWIILLLALVFPATAVAADGWEFHIVASTSAGAENKISLGQRENATDGFDGYYDVPAYVEGDISAYFPHDDWGQEASKYWRDIKALDDQKSWSFNVESSKPTITLSWKKSKILGGYSIALTDTHTGESIDMTAKDKYSYANSGQRQFVVETEAPDEVEFLEAPTDLTGQALNTSTVSLGWVDNSAAESNFIVERQALGGNWGELAFLEADTTSYTDYTADFLNEKTYLYRVRVYNGIIYSDYSDIESITSTHVTTDVTITDTSITDTDTASATATDEADNSDKFVAMVAAVTMSDTTDTTDATATMTEPSDETGSTEGGENSKSAGTDNSGKPVATDSTVTISDNFDKGPVDTASKTGGGTAVVASEANITEAEGESKNLLPEAVYVTTKNGARFGDASLVKIAFDAIGHEDKGLDYTATLYEGFGRNGAALEVVAVGPSTGYTPEAGLLKKETIYTVVFKVSDGNTDYPETVHTFVITSGTLPGDVDYNGMVDGYDLILISAAFGKDGQKSFFNPYADLKDDGVIDEDDLELLTGNFGGHKK